MGWFESQIKERQVFDESGMQNALMELTDAVTGRATIPEEDVKRQAVNAIASCLGYYGFKPKEPPHDMSDLSQLIDFQVRPTGVMYRKVTLTKNWFHDAVGPMIGFTQDGSPVALLPNKSGYGYIDALTGSKVRVNAQTARRLSAEAYCFYKPLPNRALTSRDLFSFMLGSCSRKDYLIFITLTLITVVLGLLLPIIDQIMFGPVLTNDDTDILVPILVLLIGVEGARILILTLRSFVQTSLGAKLVVSLQASLMMRVLSLPVSFFKAHTTGAVALRVSVAQALAKSLVDSVFTVLISVAFDLIYLYQIAFIAPALAPGALGVVAVMIMVLLISYFRQARTMENQLIDESKVSGWQYALMGGIQKIKLAGAEQRGFFTWAKRYAPLARTFRIEPMLLRVTSALTALVGLVGIVIIYWMAGQAHVPINDFMAFTVAFSMIMGAFLELSKTVGDIAAIKPRIGFIEPLLEAIPETGHDRPAIKRVSGNIEVDNVTFSYGAGLAPVLENFSLKIRRGSYVAIVGKSGCGKSTLMRLLLGFEKPSRGAIFFDGHDISSIDIASLRSHMGVVLPESKLFAGDIFSNIAASAPHLTLDEAWEAAEAAGIAEDIRAMPMGMATYVSEGGGISGGQRQRLIIARALASKPRILLFDEATSALDTLSQQVVVDSLDALNCTRIVIAHRLSTICACNRIIVIEDGRIAEDGTYEELINRHGIFYDLAKRQQA